MCETKLCSSLKLQSKVLWCSLSTFMALQILLQRWLGVVALCHHLVVKTFPFLLPVKESSVVLRMMFSFLRQIGQSEETLSSLWLKIQSWLRVGPSYPWSTRCFLFIDVVMETHLKFPFFSRFIWQAWKLSSLWKHHMSSWWISTSHGKWGTNSVWSTFRNHF